MPSETLVYLRDLAHGLADLAEKNDLDFIARVYRMAEMEVEQLGAGSAAAHQAARDALALSRPAA